LQEGFTGIAISLLGLSSPIGVLFAGLFYGALEMGGFYLQVTTRFVPQIIEIIIAVIIYFSALALFFQKYVQFVINKVVPEAEVGHE
jgi:simple sugar transport system permease protein